MIGNCHILTFTVNSHGTGNPKNIQEIIIIFHLIMILNIIE